MSVSRGIVINAGIGVLACASLVAVWVTSNTAGTSDSAGREQNLLPVFRTEDVQRFELFSAGQKLAVLRADTDGGSATYTLVEPVKEQADAATADKFLSELGSARALRPVEQGPTPAALGLDKPSLRVDVHTAKRTYHLALGGSAPTPEGARYLQVNDGDTTRVAVVAKSFAEELSVELDAFRMKSLVSLNEADVIRISIKSPTLDVTLRRSTGTNFLLDGEPKMLADRETLKSLFFQLGRLSANAFLSSGDAERALGANHGHFELETKDKQTTVFDAGGACPSDPAQLVVVRRAPNPQSACTTRELEATLRLATSDFSDRHPFSLHADEVEELAISGGKSKFALLRKGSGFILHAASDTQVELEAGNQRISALLEAQGERVVDAKLAELGLEPAASLVTLHSSAALDKDVVHQVVRVGNKDSTGSLFVLREQDGVVLRIPAELARAFAIDSTLLYARKLTEFGISSFISAEIEHAGTRQLLRRGENNELRLEEPRGFDLDGSLSSDLIQALGSLTAERFVADRDDGSFGLSHSRLSVRFAYKGDANAKSARRLRFGDETALGVYATLDEGGPVFILSRSVRDTCSQLLLNRSLFQTTADAFNAVTLEANGRTLRLERQGERFAPVPAGAFPADRLPQLLDALGDLRPEAAVHAGAPLPAEGFSKPSFLLHLQPRLGPAQTVTFGAGDSWRSTSVFYLRVSGVDATFVMAQSKVRALSDAL